MALIRQRPSSERRYGLVEDGWTLAAEGTPIADAADVIVSLGRLEAEASSIFARAGRTGVRLPNDRGVEPIAAWLPQLALVAIEFPKHTDGRGYSLARLLRERHAFTGEIRAVGNVLRDNLLFMHRCGFDAFELDPKYGPGGLDPEGALRAFDELDVYYQAASDVRLPLWKRVSRT